MTTIKFEQIIKFCNIDEELLNKIQRFDLIKDHNYIKTMVWPQQEDYESIDEVKNYIINEKDINYINIYMNDGSWFDCHYPYYCRLNKSEPE